MKHYNAFALAALLLLLGSCSDDTTNQMSTGNGQRLTFTVDVGGSSAYTASTTRSASVLSHTTTVRSLEMDGDGATHLYAQCHNSEGVQLHNHVAKALTRGTERTADNFYNSFGLIAYSYDSSETWNMASKNVWIDNDNVAVSDGTWTSSTYWLGSDYKAKFFAYAPNTSEITATANNGSTPTISYTVPSDIDSQHDLLVAVSDDDISCDGKSDVVLTFRHVLTAVKFTAEHIDGYSKITNITLSGIQNQGTYSYDSKTWDDQQGSANYSLIGEYETSTAFTDISRDKLMLLMPQTLQEGATLSVTMSDGANEKTFTADLKGKVWQPGHTMTYKISLKKVNGEYHFEVTQPTDLTATEAAKEFSYKVTSYFESNNTRKAIPWTADYAVDGESERHSEPIDVVSSFQAKSPDVVISNPSALESQTQEGKFKIAEVTIALSDPDNTTTGTHTENLRNATPVTGSSSNPYDLSTIGGTTSRNTANCYIVSAAGWYSLPLVYGNAIKNGGNNEAVYGTTLATFVNSAGKTITAPYLKDNAGITPDHAVLVWQDAYHLIDPSSVRISNDKERLIFRVPQEYICQGNCVLAVRDASKDILWSWHIWVTDQSMTTLPAKNGYGTYNFMPVALGHCDADTRKYLSHTINVKITQNESGTSSDFTINQSTTTTQNFGVTAPYYQWGRKDPQHPSYGGTSTSWKPLYDNTSYPNISTGSGGYNTNTPTLADGIKNPHVFYGGWNSISNLDLWHIGNTYYDENYISANKPVAKSIYDPCPVGFKMPHINAFSAFSTSATWNGTIFSRPFISGNNWYAYGYINGGSLSYVGSLGHYWSAGPYSTTNGYCLGFSSGLVNLTTNGSRAYGFSVRPVSE